MKKIVVHARCVDGFLSGVILRDTYLGAELVAIGHGTDEERNLVAEPGMLFCDTAPPRARWKEFINEGAIVLDHHATSVDWFMWGGAGVFASEPGVSGAVLACQHRLEVMGPPAFADRAADEMQLREIARLVGIYDTWQIGDPEFPRARRMHATLDLLMRTGDPSLGPTMLIRYVDQLTLAVEMMDRANVAEAKEVASRAIVIPLDTPQGPLKLALIDGGTRTPVLNMVPEHLAPDIDLMVTARYTPATASGIEGVVSSPPRVSVSLRSRNGKVDCSQIASRLGGGGHAGAAGFTSESLQEVRPIDLAYMMIISTFQED